MQLQLLIVAVITVNVKQTEAGMSSTSTPFKICEIWGDPHYTTFDIYAGHFPGDDPRSIHFQGMCTYLLSGSRNCLHPHTYFRVLGENEPWQTSGTSVLERIIIQWNGYTILFNKGGTCHVENGMLSLVGSGASVECNSGSVMKFTAPDIEVTYDGHHTSFIRLGQTYFDSVEGICGNNNGDPSDDYRTRTGINVIGETPQSKRDNLVGNSFQLGCDPGHTHDTTFLEELYGKKKRRKRNLITVCDVIFPNDEGVENPFIDCFQEFPEIFRDYFETCVFDVAFTCEDENEGETVTCSQFAMLAERCFRLTGNHVFGWREYFNCPMICPNGYEYVADCPSCPATCDHPTPCDRNGLPCCMCKEGTVLRGNKCVPYEKCQCVDASGNTHKVGSTWLSPIDCSMKYTCNEDYSITEEEYECPRKKMCVINLGYGKCIPRNCECLCDEKKVILRWNSTEYDSLTFNNN